MNSRDDISRLLNDAAALFDAGSATQARLRETAERLNNPHWTVLMSGLRSVGKSSFVCSLWGDSQLLPTAERDCTQVNTLLRLPENSEAEPHVKLSYLSREAALDFATRGLAYYHLTSMLADSLGPAAPDFEELNPEERVRTAVTAVRKVFAERPQLQVLNENLSDDLEELEQLLAFLDSPQFKSGATVDGEWKKLRDYVMGLRRPDGRTFDVGPLLALRHVEIVRRTERWPNPPAPQIIDTPFVPTFHNARRMDLILALARRADVLVIVARPEPYALEDWTKKIFKERPELASQTLVVFNQIDTVDAANLFTRDGWSQAYAQNVERLAEAGIKREHLLMSCARLPFLLGLPQNDSIRERTAKLRAVLARLRKLADGRPGEFKNKFLRACNENDGGIEALREKLLALGQGSVQALRTREALQLIDGISALEIAPDKLGAFMKVREAARRFLKP